MKVVLVTTSSKGGAGIAALRLYNALKNAGVSSAFLSRDLTIDFKGSEKKDPFFEYKKASLFSRAFRKFGLGFSSGGQDRMRREVSELADTNSFEIYSLPFSPYELQNHPLIKQADIIHLHWVSGLINFETFFHDIKKPIAWTLHDMNPFLGLFHYQGDTDRNFQILQEVEEKVREIKRAGIQHVINGALITPSQWLLDESNVNDVFQKFQIKENIANAIDLETFQIRDKKEARSSLSLDTTSLVLLFSAGNLEIYRKGADLLMAALELLDIPLTLLTLGQGDLSIQNPSVTVIPLGFVKSEEEMAVCYSASDAFVLPSREDNLPNTMLESFACGIPVLSYARGGMKEYIREGLNGFLAPECTPASLAESIEKFYHQRNSFDSKKIRKFAEEHFHPEKQAEKYQKVYLRLVKATTPNQ
ncbi:MAG: hypothetical protein Aureis2KO_20240 [Aureisphaera sp.]